ncbi:upstream stimulatory factor 1-like isoform X2 [Watersipora subatra]|uniref:upstream stimulatory factor 1-like isoform X1 n=1 Tax=Watersipora subatra TaxID=2589382 RepID=UPI00355BA31D
MDELQPELDNPTIAEGDIKEASLVETEDAAFQTDGGQPVSYSVLQVADGDDHTLSLPTGSTVTQAVISSPFTATDANSDTTFAYIPAGSVNAGGDNEAVVTNIASTGGQFYVMMSPQDVIQGQRPSARGLSGGGSVTSGGKYNRDDRRRNTHNEVERRRRDKINNWIVTLSKLIPDCAETNAASSTVSKSGILAKACEYIADLKEANLRLAESLKESETIAMNNELLRQQLEQSKDEISLLRRTLEQNGLEATGLPTAPPDAQ